MLDLAATTVGYARGFRLTVVPTRIAAGEIVAVIGPSGSGKSTFLHSVAGALDLREPITADRNTQSYVMHEPHLMPWRTVRGHIKTESAMRGQAFDWGGFETHLQRVGLTPTVLELHARELSLGMRQRVEFLIGLSFKVDLLLGDEVFSGIDQANKLAMMGLALDYVGQGRRTLVFTSHFPADVLRVATRVLAVANGQIAPLALQFAAPPAERLTLPLDALLRLHEFEIITRSMS